MNKLIDLVKIALILTVILCGCAEMHTGYYKVESVRNNNTVTFKGIKGDYHFPNDSIKVGDKVFLQRVLKYEKANVWTP